MTEDRREREFSEKMFKTTLLSEAALYKVCHTSVLHHLHHFSHTNREGEHNEVECSKHLLQLCKRCMNMNEETPLSLCLSVKKLLIILQVKEENQVNGGLVIL